MKTFIRKWLLGDTVFSAYVNVTFPDHPQQKVWLRAGKEIIDISGAHWLLCIEPIVFGVWISNQSMQVADHVENFSMIYGGNTHPNGQSIENEEACINLQLLESIVEETGVLFLLKFCNADIYQLNTLKRYLLFFRYYRKDGLKYARFKEYVTSYSYPRKIRVVSFREGDYYNIFPMDLLGDIPGSKWYVFGLRHTNIALTKIIESGRLAVCEVSFQFKDTIYQLGKHHSSKMPAVTELSFETIQSKSFSFHIPAWVQDCKEVRIFKTVDMGSHMLLWGEVIDAVTFSPSSQPLYLVHLLHYLEAKKRGIEYTRV